MASIYQLLRFTLPQSNATRLSTFQALRDRVSSDSVKTQYFGYMILNEGFPDRTAENDMCWVISKVALSSLSMFIPQPSALGFSLVRKLTITNVQNGLKAQHSKRAPSSKQHCPPSAKEISALRSLISKKRKRGTLKRGLKPQFVNS